MTAPPPEPRIGDQARRAVDTRLQDATSDGALTLAEYEDRSARCWAARTRGELDALVADLPPLATEPVTTRKSPAPTSTGGSGLLARIGSAAAGLAVVAVAVLAAGQVLGAADGAAVFSSRTVQVADDQDTLQVGALFGSVQVVVPEGVRARTTGPSVFSSVECLEACSGGPELREVVIDVRSGFASVEITR